MTFNFKCIIHVVLVICIILLAQIVRNQVCLLLYCQEESIDDTLLDSPPAFGEGRERGKGGREGGKGEVRREGESSSPL